jgi:chloramphenicol 3-O phosphotransferase
MPSGFTASQIVILNGPPRSGKSSIAAAIQETFEGVWVNLGVDCFMAMTPARYQPGIGLRPGGERPDLEPIVAQMYLALYDSIAAHSRLGLNVVVDVGHHDSYSKPLSILPECARRLDGLPVLFVGVRCPLDVIIERRKATGWDSNAVPDPSLMRRVAMWEREVHSPGLYDMEVNTSTMTTVECAEAIRQRLENGPNPSAFATLAART